MLKPGIEVNVGKAAVEPVWYLPGVAGCKYFVFHHLNYSRSNDIPLQLGEFAYARSVRGYRRKIPKSSCHPSEN